MRDSSHGFILGYVLGLCFQGGTERAEVADEWSEAFDIASGVAGNRPKDCGNDWDSKGPNGSEDMMDPHYTEWF
ncbi:hypothetical protein F5050DRAFT_1813509 [Lentinula boryana]|uniref:Uncharacterized protein n=1 Tax=Lentinula boryana TaxID=40481 RepID=A0ABQ8PWP5_9AGAR|nr:hypothetical protein F5050DRAFT_1813509 [Lentinula boryana]